MKNFKSTVADRLFFPDGPPAYEHEVVANLEVIADANVNTANSLDSFNKSFSNISGTLESKADELISTVGEGFEDLQSELEYSTEVMSEGFTDLKYTLLDIDKSIGGLHRAVERSGYQISQAIQDASSMLSDRIDQTNRILQAQLTLVNSSLQIISGQLTQLIGMISRPNETESLELADQARQNISLGKKERALDITSRAMELSGGTSITVLAYHILTLSLFKDKVDALLTSYEDYADLIVFKLSDERTDKSVVVKELETTLYSVIAVTGYRYRHRVEATTLKIYSALDQAGDLTFPLLGFPLASPEIRQLISFKNFLREIHWSLLLTQYVIPKNDSNAYLDYFRYLTESGTLIENELLVMGIKHFEKSGLMYQVMAECLTSDCNQQTLDALQIIFAMLPQDGIPLDDYSLWLIHELVRTRSIKINETLQKQIDPVEQKFHKDLDSYKAIWDQHQTLLQEKEQVGLETLEKFAIKLNQEREEFDRESSEERLREKLNKNIKLEKQRLKDLDHYEDEESAALWAAVGFFATFIIGYGLYLIGIEFSVLEHWFGAIFVFIVLIFVAGGIGWLLERIVKANHAILANGAIKTINTIRDENPELVGKLEAIAEKKKRLLHEQEKRFENKLYLVPGGAYRDGSEAVEEKYDSITQKYYKKAIVSSAYIDKTLGNLLGGNLPENFTFSQAFVDNYNKLHYSLFGESEE